MSNLAVPSDVKKLTFVQSQHNTSCAVFTQGNHYVVPVGSKQLNKLIREAEPTLSKYDIAEINEHLIATIEENAETKDVYYRVAPIKEGIEIDLNDKANTRVRVTAGRVEVLANGSETLFQRNSVSNPMVIPAPEGNLDLLKKYTNFSAPNYLIFVAWLSYTLALPKRKTSKFVILALKGDQGTCKSFLCQHVILSLLDPNRAGLQKFPKNVNELAIASQQSHVLCYDNLRTLNQEMSDALCIASTGGSISSRALYTNSEQNINHLHVALVLNGIHDFVRESDLAQRCLTLDMKVLPESQRKSEEVMVSEFEADLPTILKGLLDLIAKVFNALPNAKVVNPERMYDFSRWLAAMEIAYNVQIGVYQSLYSFILNEAQLDTLMSNPLAMAIIDFCDELLPCRKWVGTPKELLDELKVSKDKQLPQNPIALSKRLTSIKAALLSQGISVELTRGKSRQIKIQIVGA